MSAQDLLVSIGAMKAGTTTLFKLLSQHPKIVPCRVREPNFFSRDEQWARGLDWYLDLWDAVREDEVALEKSTTYSKRPRYPDTVDRMAHAADEHGLTFRFLYILRDPISRIESHLTHLIAGGKLEDQVVNWRRGSLDGNSLCISMYAHQLDVYTRTFEREKIHLIKFEDLVTDPIPQLDAVAEFLGLEPHEFSDPSEEHHNPTVGKYVKGSVWKAAEKLQFDHISRQMPDPARRALRELLGERIEAKCTLDPAQREAVLHLLEGDLTRLRDHYGFDLTGWTLPPSLQES